MPTTTKRTPALAYLAALIALLVVWAAYRPALRAWYELQNRAPSVAEAVELLRSDSAERQREGLASAARMRPVADEVLTAVSSLAFAAPDEAVRRQAALYLSGVAQQQALPDGTLQRLPPLTPEMDPGLATIYATIIHQAARERPPPPNAIAFLDALMERGDRGAKDIAILALGQVGFYHGLDDAHVAQLTAMAAYEDAMGNRLHGADAAWALKLTGQKQSLPPVTLDVLVDLMRNGRDNNARQRAVWAVSTQVASLPALADAIEAALDDPDVNVRGAARQALYDLEKAQPADLELSLQAAADEAEPGTRRLRALQRLLQQAPTDDRVRALAQRMARDEDTELRAGVASMASALPNEDAEALFAAALEDADARVRAAVVLPLMARGVADGEDGQLGLIRRFLADPAPEVQRNVLLAIRSHQLNSDAVRDALRDMETDDPRLDRERATLLDSLELADRTSWQRFGDAAFEPKNFGVYAFVTVAGLAALVCAFFLLYFTARCFVYLSARQWRALTALGIVAAWVGASFALGWAFFVGAFVGGGHNSAPPLGWQLSVVGVLLLLVGAYALLGFGLRRLVRT